MNLDRLHVAITGASSGIGEAIARAFAQAGARVTLVARRAELLQILASELKESFVATQDLSRSETADQWIENAEKAFGPIDVLINNAGVQIVGPTSAVNL